MDRVDLSEQQRNLIERIGVLHDRLGIPPAAGRVLGLLLVSTEPELTFDQIRDTLGLSKSSTSTALSLLQQVRSVDYSTRPGDRKRYFRKDYESWEDNLLDRFDLFFSLGDLLDEAAKLKGADAGHSAAATERMVDLLAHLKTEIHRAHDDWKRRGTPDLERKETES